MRAVTATLAALALVGTVGSTAVAGPSDAAEDERGTPSIEAGEPAPDAPEVETLEIPDEAVPLDTTATRLRFRTAPGVALELADGRRFLDTLELRLDGGEQRLINELTADDYVAGVAEMPGRWHLEALKAQAVAARTYAWHLIELGTFDSRGFDICDTIDCQVFVGARQQESDFGDRWRAAVDATAGEVLIDDDGAPILARYFSTSGGRTLANEEVFPSSGPRPYLVGTDDPQDAVSPFHRWEVTFTREEFDAVTGAGETLAPVTPVAEVERLGPLDIPDVDLRFTGADGTTVTLGSVEVRRFISEVAPRRFPERFPSLRADGLRRLPATIPSGRYEIEVGDDEVVVTGRGWGHAVGMGQYGALGRARDGETYDRILEAYYNGLTPTTTDALPERVRVGLSRVEVGSVRGDAPFTVWADDEVLTEGAAGTWTLRREGDRVGLTAPPGWGRPAEVSRTEVATTLPSGARAVAVMARSTTPGEARLVVRDGTGETVLDRTLGAVAAGDVPTRWDLRDDDGETVAAGRYEVAIEVVADDGTRDGTALPVEVSWTAPSLPGVPAQVPQGPLALTVVLLLLAGGAVAMGARRRTAARVADRPASPVDAGPSARDARSEPGGQEAP